MKKITDRGKQIAKELLKKEIIDRKDLPKSFQYLMESLQFLRLSCM